MKIWHSTPFARDKNLGRAYNEEFKKIGPKDWLVIRDIDTILLTPEAPNIIEDYINAFPGTGIFTCFCNRVSPSAKAQLHDGMCSINFDIRHHTRLAQNYSESKQTATEINHVISGMLMVISKKTWNKIKFSETGKCLAVDHLYSQSVLSAGLKIRRIDRLYIFHAYRILNGINDKKHLL